MIVKNEEAIIEKCLKSIKDLDEIVIIDTGSVDKTPEICRRYTDKIIVGEYKWNDDFAEARNFANSKCTGDWILVLDADEELEKGGVEKIRQAVAKAKGDSIDVIVYSGKTQFDSVRIFKNKPEIFYKGAIHNYLNIAEKNKSDIKIKFGYSQAHKDDPDRALRILKKEISKNPKVSREKFYLGREYIYRRNWPSAIYWLERYLEKDTWAPEKAHAYLLLAKALFYTRQPDKAKNVCLQAIKINADFKEAIELMAELSGPNNKKRWLEFSKTANNKNVLFRKQ